MSRSALFRLIAALFVAAALYHLAAFLQPAFGIPGARWRHALFCLIDFLCAWYLTRRPRWFVGAFAVLTVYSIWSHGSQAWRLWHEQERLDWLSFSVIAVVPLALALLIRDALDRRSRQSD